MKPKPKPKKKTPDRIQQSIQRKVELTPANQVRQDEYGFVSPVLESMRRNRERLTPDQRVQLEDIERARRERYNAPVRVDIPSYRQRSGQQIPAFRNNNPGNIRNFRTGEFVRYDTPAAGVRALEQQLRIDTARDLTVEEFVYKYAPPGENDTERYIQQLTNSTGTTRSSSLRQVPLTELTSFIAKKESGTKITRQGGFRGSGAGGTF